EGLIRVDADIQPGDSGGPIVDSRGRVVGIVTAGSVGLESVSSAAQGFAIPIDQAVATARQIESGNSPTPVYVGPSALLGVVASNPGDDSGDIFGFGGDPGGSSTSGVAVAEVTDGEPAQRAGLTPGAVITSLDGHAVDSPSTLSTL